MPLELKQLLEERGQVSANITKMADTLGPDKPDFTSEERATWDSLNARHAVLSRQIDVLHAAAEARAAIDRQPHHVLPGREDTGGPPASRDGDGAPTEEDRCLAIQAWALAQYDEEPTERQLEAAQRCGIKPRSRTLEIPLWSNHDYRTRRVQARAMGTTPAPAGGYLVPTGFVSMLEIAMLQWDAMRQVADIIRTDTGEDIAWPMANDSSNEGEVIGENRAHNEQDVAVQQKKLGSYEFSSKIVRVSNRLLRDSAFDLVQTIAELLGERIGRRQNRAFTVGSGASEPTGIVTDATLGKTAASASAITHDEIIDLIHSVDPAYRRGPSVGFMMHDAIIAVVRKLKDSQGRYLWEDSTQAGQPPRLRGYPVWVNNSMASALASNAKVMLFGDFSKYKIRDVGTVRLKRLVERYGEYDQDGFVAIMSSDGKLLDAGTAPVKYLANAA
jgi:HK97 family phage major capsid protein